MTMRSNVALPVRECCAHVLLDNPSDIAFRAYVDKDRAALGSILADDFHFTSPLDNRIDRKTYLGGRHPFGPLSQFAWAAAAESKPTASVSAWPTMQASKSRFHR
jgi:hypothetical protein